jgi:hypothetical protein
MSEDCARLVVEHAVAILTEILLKLSIAAVSDCPARTAARTVNTIPPANLFQQVRCDRFRPKHIERNNSYGAPRQRCAYSLRNRSAISKSYARAKIID